MSLRQRYRSLDDISMRHNGTYVGLPSGAIIMPYRVVGVSGTVESPTFDLQGVGTARSNTITRNYADIIFNKPTPCLANITTNSGKTIAVWPHLVPARQVKRSLSFDHLNFEHVAPRQQIQHSLISYNLNDTNRGIICGTMFNKQYPTFREALQQLENNVAYSVAFSTKFSVCLHPRCGIALHYKTRLIGWVADGAPVLHERFQYLNEQLQEVTNVDA